MLTGAACLLGRLPPLPLAFFVAPYPPSPLPRRGRGRPRLFHARGFAPCIPGIKPLAAQAEPEKQALGGGLPRRCRLTLSCRCPAAEAGRRWDGASPAPGGGLPPALPVDTTAVVFAWAACIFGCLPALPLVLILPPFPEGEGYPPTLFPGEEGGDSKIILPGATAPGTPAFDRLRHLQTLPCRCSGADLARHRLNLRSRHPAGAYPRRCRLTLSCRDPAAEPGRH